MTHQDCIIYTERPSKALETAGKIAEKYLNQTKGRTLKITWRKAKRLQSIPTTKSDEVIVRPDWLWMRSKFGDLTHEIIGVHFTTQDRKRFKLTKSIDGSSHFHMGIGYFYMCVNPNAMAPGYDSLPEVSQLIIHEIAHIDQKITGAPWEIVHAFEAVRRIHELPQLFAYPNNQKTMVRPLESKYWKNVSQRFMEPNDHYLSDVHPGVDFRTPVGTPFIAPCDLEIYQRFTNHPSLGNAIFCRFTWSGRKYWMRVLHGTWCAPKGKYKQGELIFKTGNTGDSSGPHCHADVWTTAIDSNLIKTKAGVAKHMLDPVAFVEANISK